MTLQIAIVPRTQQLLSSPQKMNEVAAATAAIQKQILVDFAPFWKMDAVLMWAPLNPPANYIPVFIDDFIAAPPGVSGLHGNKGGLLYAVVKYGPTWTLAASHEILELLGNTDGMQVVPGVIPGTATPVRHLREVCDPCQDIAFAYGINGFPVSDFCLPEYFGLVPPAARLTFNLQKPACHAPFDVAPGGSQYWLDPANNLYTRVNVGGVYSGGLLGKYNAALPRLRLAKLKGDTYLQLSDAWGDRKAAAAAIKLRARKRAAAKLRFDKIVADRKKLNTKARKAAKKGRTS